LRLLVTGGAGFIGSNLAQKLAGAGLEVTMLDSLLSQVHGTDPEQSELLQAARAAGTVVVGDVTDRWADCGRTAADRNDQFTPARSCSRIETVRKPPANARRFEVS